MPQLIEPQEFLELACELPVLDVRSPSEYQAGHIPGAVSFPLFDDEQRHQVGLTYSKQGHQPAVLKGLEFVGPKMKTLAKSALKHCRSHSSDEVLVHCWRGGMRSQSVAWLLEQVDLKPVLLSNGYKGYRRYIHETFRKPFNIIVLSGLTGAGKTEKLEKLRQAGEQVIDLEKLANHRGSAFGGIGQPDQPTVEQFENELGRELLQTDPHRRVWLEDESKKIGAAIIPDDFFNQKRTAPAVFIEVDVATRAKHIRELYGDLDPTELVNATERITKRFGGQNVLAVKQLIDAGNIQKAVELLLEYYDRSYLLAKSKQPPRTIQNLTIAANETNVEQELIAAADQLTVTAKT